MLTIIGIQSVQQVQVGQLMKKAFPILIVTIVFVCAAMAAAQQSVADAARQARTQKHAAATIVVEGQSLPQLTSLASDGSDAAKDESKKRADQRGGDGKDAPKKSATEQLKEKADGWNQKIDAQKKEIATLQREMDILVREQRLRAAA